MKNIFYFAFLLVATCFVSCSEDDPAVYDSTRLSDSNIEFESLLLDRSATNIILAKLSPNQVVDLGAQVGLGAAPKGGALNYTYEVVDPSTVVVGEGIEVNTSGSVPSGKLVANLPITVSLDDFPLGEPNTISLKLTSSDAGITDSRVVTYTFTVVCPSDIAGEYTSTTTGQSTDDCCPDPVTVDDGMVTISGADGAYTINDFSAGLYLEWYAAYGITPEFATDGRLSSSIGDVCNELSGTATEPFDSEVNLSGSVDPMTGVITYTWTNGFDDTATVVLTPK